MIRLSLAELQRIVKETNNAYACGVTMGGVGWKDGAQEASDRTLARVLRQLHLSTWADALERQTKVVTGD